MRAALLHAPRDIAIREIESPTLSAGEVLVRPTRVGICGSDLSLLPGPPPPPAFPFVLGHEVTGRVEAVAADVTNVEVGQSILVEPNYPCGTCRFCASKRGSICPHKVSMGVTVPGCYAEFVKAPATFTWPVPSAVSEADAATIEPLAVALHAFRRSGALPGDTVAVLGCGVIGLLLVHVAVTSNVRVLAYDKVREKIALAGRLGAEAVDTDDVAALWAREHVATVFECAGGSTSAELALAWAPRGSTVVLMGLSNATASFVPLRLVREGIRVEPSLIYDHPRDFADTIRLVAAGVLTPSAIVTDTFSFDEIANAMATATGGSSGKVHILFE